MSGVKQLYPSLTRDASAKVLGLIARAAVSGEDEEEEFNDKEFNDEESKKSLPLSFDLQFANDGLMCEWVYVLNLDKDTLEIFGGSEHKHDDHRFKDVGKEEDNVPAHICTFSFSELLLATTTEDEFLRQIKKASGRDEEEDSKE